MAFKLEYSVVQTEGVCTSLLRHESRTSMRPQDVRTSTTKKSSLPNNRNSIDTVDSETDSENDLKAPAEDDDKRKSLRASLAGVEVTNRLGQVYSTKSFLHYERCFHFESFQF